ncbi:hypothetical protein [Sphingosinicella sp.]|uniref:hypothetical protein n=1 Tax=Sphingosinicella sp. TaxID=1917971 RepID=UPI004037FE66
MEQSRSREALLSFLDYLGEKGLMAPATAAARKVAANKVLGILDEKEADDVLSLDLQDVMTRFSHLQGKGFTPGSLATYQSRLKSALDDFSSYVQNPLAFRPKTQVRKKAENGQKPLKKPQPHAARVATAEPETAVRATPTSFVAPNILPIQLRENLTIQIQGLPFDLSKSEAQKLANVILALAS